MGSVPGYPAQGYLPTILSSNVVYPETYGAHVDGITDESAAWNKALAAIPSSGGMLVVTPGQHLLAGPINIAARRDIAIVGYGRNASMIVMGAANFYLFTLSGAFSRIIIKDCWLGSLVARSTGGGISAIGTGALHADNLRTIRCTLQNLPNPLVMQYIDQWRHDDLQIIQSIAGATVGAAVTMNTALSGRFDNIQATATVGTYPQDVIQLDYDCDTILFVNGEIAQGGGATGAGLHLLNSAGGTHTGPRLVRAFGMMIEACVHGFRIEDCRLLELHGCHSAVNAQHGYLFTGGTGIKCVGGDSQQNGHMGYEIFGVTGDVLLQGVTASNNGTSASNTYDGCRIDDNSKNVTVNGGTFADFVTLPSTQRYGLSTSSTGTDYLTILGIRTATGAGNLTGGLGNFSTGTHNQVANNQ